jgi:hypothetical protein
MLFPALPSSTASKDGTSNELITTTIGAGHSQVRYPYVSRSAALFARSSKSETASELTALRKWGSFYDKLLDTSDSSEALIMSCQSERLEARFAEEIAIQPADDTLYSPPLYDRVVRRRNKKVKNDGLIRHPPRPPQALASIIIGRGYLHIDPV